MPSDYGRFPPKRLKRIWSQLLRRNEPIQRRNEPTIQEALAFARLGLAGDAYTTLVKTLASVDIQSASPALFENVVETIDCLTQSAPSYATEGRRVLASTIFPCTYPSTCLEEPRIAYIASSPLPSTAANCVHVMKMCSAIRGNGYITGLFFIQNSAIDKIDHDDFFSAFGVLNNFEYLAIMPCKNSSLQKVLSAISWGATHVYTRSVRSAYFAALGGVPTLLELHAPVQERHRSFARELFRSPSFVGLVVISNALRNKLFSDFAELRDRITTLPDAADPPSVNTGLFKLSGRPDGKINVGYVGQLYQGKGVDIVIRLAASLPAVNFHVFGGGEEDVSYFENKVANLNNITFYGHHPHTVVPSILESLDIVVAPYQRSVMAHGGTLDISEWMSPLKIFEYMASGKPIIASDLAILREVLEDRRNALLCDPEDIADWIQAIETLSKDQKLRKALGNTAKTEFEEKFTWARRAQSALYHLFSPAERRQA